jgi:hypothetical protein
LFTSVLRLTTGVLPRQEKSNVCVFSSTESSDRDENTATG